MKRIEYRPIAGLILVTAVLSYVGCTSRSPSPTAAISPASASKESGTPKPQKLLADWSNPAAVLIVSGQQDGYLEPCGCSAEQIGGLIRRYDFIERLHKQNWPIALIDLGGLIKNPADARGGFEQAKFKFDYAVKALKLLDYNAVALAPRT